MKTLLLLLLLLPLGLWAQNQPFKKANTIIIETGLTAEEAFMAWGRYLSQNGFTIADSNKDFFTLSTGPKDTSKMNYSILLDATVAENGDIVIKPKWKLKSSIIAGTQATDFYQWVYRGPNEITTKDILQVVNGFGEYPVAYLTK